MPPGVRSGPQVVEIKLPWKGSVMAGVDDGAAAAAKLLQLCLTLGDPIDSSPSGSAIPGILQARTLE